MMARLKRIKKVFFILSCWIVIILVLMGIFAICEFYFKCKANREISRIIPDKYLGWNINPAQFPERFKITNKQTKPFKKILFLGDSFIEPDFFAQYLSEKIINSGNKNIELINAGVEGYGTDQYYLKYLLINEAIRPDIVICVFFIGNDVGNTLKAADCGGYQRPYFLIDKNEELTLHNYPVITPEVRENTDRFSPLVKHELKEYQPASITKTKPGKFSLLKDIYAFFNRDSYFINEIRRRFHKHIYIPLEKMDFDYFKGHGFIFQENYGKDLNNAWKLQELIFKNFKESAAFHNQEFILVAIPHIWQINPEAQKRFLKVMDKKEIEIDLYKPNRILKQIAEKNNIKYIDLTETMKKTESPESSLFDCKHAHAHWSHKGHKLFASVLYNYLTQNDLIN